MTINRICIITPGHLGSTPRVVKEADALAEAGYRVRVVAGDVAPFVRPRDADVLAHARWECDLVDLGSRPGHLSRRLRSLAAQRALDLGMGTARLAEWAHDAMTTRLERAADRPADLYIAHYVAALPAAAARAARRHGARYAFDAEDYHPGDHPPTPDNDARLRAIDLIERRYLRGCAYVTASSPGVADAYAQTYDLPRPTVILNVFSRAQAPARPSDAGSVCPGPSLYWFSQTIGPGRGLEVAIEAIARSRSRPRLHLRGTPAPGYLDILFQRAKDHGVRDLIHVLEPAVPSAMERLAAAFDVGLASEIGDTPNHRIALANKLFTYLLAGIPVVASDIPAHASLGDLDGAIHRYGARDPDALAYALDSLLLDPAKLAAARRQAWQLGQDRYNWDIEKFKLLAIVGDAAGLKICARQVAA